MAYRYFRHYRIYGLYHYLYLLHLPISLILSLDNSYYSYSQHNVYPLLVRTEGGSLLHIFIAYGQRARYLQPDGSFERSGGWPLIKVILSFSESSLGIEDTRACVYGCLGLVYISRELPNSTN